MPTKKTRMPPPRMLPVLATNGSVVARLVGRYGPREGFYRIYIRGARGGPKPRVTVTYRVFKGRRSVRSLLKDYAHTQRGVPASRKVQMFDRYPARRRRGMWQSRPRPRLMSKRAMELFPGGPHNRVIAARTLNDASICWYTSFSALCLQFHARLRAIFLKAGDAHVRGLLRDARTAAEHKAAAVMRRAVAALHRFRFEPFRKALYTVLRIGPHYDLNGEDAYFNAIKVLRGVGKAFGIVVEYAYSVAEAEALPISTASSTASILVLDTETVAPPPLRIGSKSFAGAFVGNMKCAHQLALVRRGQHLIGIDSNMAVRGIAPGMWKMTPTWHEDLVHNDVLPVDQGTRTSEACDAWEPHIANHLHSLYV